jgi:tryptophan 2,3-dioxygenase
MSRQPQYWDYLNLGELLSLQGGLEGDDQQLMPDELHFIVVHQVFELWFKLVLREMRLARDHLAAPQVPEEHIPHVVHHLSRVNSILQLLVRQFQVMETLTPQDFLAFRNKLVPASGFQSWQMRELEILIGLEDEQRERLGGLNPVDFIARSVEHSDSPAGRLAVERIEAVRKEQSLRAALHAWLFRTPVQGSSPADEGDAEAVADFVERYLEAHDAELDRQAGGLAHIEHIEPHDRVVERFNRAKEAARTFLTATDQPAEHQVQTSRIRAGVLFIESYREVPLLAWPRLLLDQVVELEEQLVLFRTRHARMVERIIGRRVGTGGSSGVEYLDNTTRYRVFGELWTVRTLLLPRAVLPPLEHPERYSFAGV